LPSTLDRPCSRKLLSSFGIQLKFLEQGVSIETVRGCVVWKSPRLLSRGYPLDRKEKTYSNRISDFNNSRFHTPTNFSAAAFGVDGLAPLG